MQGAKSVKHLQGLHKSTHLIFKRLSKNTAPFKDNDVKAVSSLPSSDVLCGDTGSDRFYNAQVQPSDTLIARLWHYPPLKAARSQECSQAPRDRAIIFTGGPYIGEIFCLLR